MNTNILPTSTPKTRIESIDVLRAFIIFGILFEHCIGGFGFGFLHPENALDSAVKYSILTFIMNKSALAFNFLFGLSFYLMLRNPAYDSKKFVWRCFLLILIGIFNKLFYTLDILMWYGFWGMTLVFFRKLSAKTIAITGAIIFIINTLFPIFFDIQSIPTPTFPQRYYLGESIFQIISYPLVYSIAIDMLGHLYSPFGMLSIALFGYALGKSGIMDHLESIMKIKTLVILWITTITVQLLRLKMFDALYLYEAFLAAMTYSYTILFIYYRTPLRRYLKYLSSYGLMGLTNYSMMGIIMVTCLSSSGLNLAYGSFSQIFLFGIALYVAQAIFSHYWLKRYMYGPYEWVWRCCTQLKWLPLRRPRPVAETA